MTINGWHREMFIKCLWVKIIAEHRALMIFEICMRRKEEEIDIKYELLLSAQYNTNITCGIVVSCSCAMYNVLNHTELLTYEYHKS
jgi:hypothetical protein